MISYRYFTEKGVAWRHHHGAFVPLTMRHVVPPLSPQQALRFVVRHRAPFLRSEEALDQLGSAEWWHFIKDVPEDLSSLSSNTRSKVRRGLKPSVASPAECVDNEVEKCSGVQSARSNAFLATGL